MPDEYTAIRQLAERYVDAVNRRDQDAWLATWAPDGVFDYGHDDPPRSHNALARFWDMSVEGMEVLMSVTSGVVERVEGDTAKARWYHTEYVQRGDATPLAGLTLYEDDVVRIDGEWRFALREHYVLFSGELEGSFYPYDPR